MVRTAEAQATRAAPRAISINAEVLRIAQHDDLWPGFRPSGIPLAIFDGTRTWLFRHPSSVPGFAPYDSAHGVLVMMGRHDSVTSNSSAEVGGVLAATLMADRLPDTVPLRAIAAIAIHEAFHVFQRARHATWQANEVDLFTYPSDVDSLLALSHLESAMLDSAMQARDGTLGVCSARAAMAYRTRRFAAMDSVHSAYERHSELNEGLATYVEVRAAGVPVAPIPSDGFPAAAVRERAYIVGPVLGVLLDRLEPDWRERLEHDDSAFLDELLAAAARDARVECPSAPRLSAGDLARARQEIAALSAERATRRARFDARQGTAIEVIAAGGSPLWPQGFDPLNVERVEGALLHTRFLRLGNASGSLEMLALPGVTVEAITESAGPHPLFTGVRRVIIRGVSEVDVAPAQDGRVVVRTPGLSLEFSEADVRRTGEVTTLQLR